MRIIDRNPGDVVPELTESDIQKNLIVATMYSTNMGGQLVAYVTRIRDVSKIRGYVLNWYGGKITDDKLYLWNHNDYHNGNLLKFVTKSWNGWLQSNPIIYVCETPQDIMDLCETINLTNANIIMELQEALRNARASIY